METEAKAKVVASILGGRIYLIPCRASCFASGDLEEKVEFILFFISSWCSDDLCLLFCLSLSFFYSLEYSLIIYGIISRPASWRCWCWVGPLGCQRTGSSPPYPADQQLFYKVILVSCSYPRFFLFYFLWKIGKFKVFFFVRKSENFKAGDVFIADLLCQTWGKFNLLEQMKMDTV